MSRSTRITILLVIDILFFLVELVVGYAVGSLALVADSFHMLNDVMSLVVALYAIKLSASTSIDSRYSYGWHRAEILAALINGVFLLALCFSISMEAIGRFFTVPEISNPRLIVVVGSLGLASNIVGLFLFHEHAHEHVHSAESSPSKPSSVVSPTPPDLEREPRLVRPRRLSVRRRKRSRSPEHADSFSSLYGHPAATRASLVQTANEIASARSPSPPPRRQSMTFARVSSEGDAISHTHHANIVPESPLQETATFTEETPLLEEANISQIPPKKPHPPSGSMNMRALILHVLGDALGNVGVISTGLVIWLSSWTYKFYFDPVISLVITAIIFSSALPLVRSASFILLQGVPPNISLDEVRDSILEVEGVISLHELHVWQLSESKIVASVHVLTSREHDFMPVAAKIRKALHHHGIHSSTIQPEYYCIGGTSPDESPKMNSDTSCLILCPPDQECDPTNACCPPPPIGV